MRYTLNDPKVIKKISSEVDSLLRKELLEKAPTIEGKLLFLSHEDSNGTEYSTLDDSVGVGVNELKKGSKFDIQFRILWVDADKFVTLANNLWQVKPTDILQNFGNVKDYFLKMLGNVNLSQALGVELLKHLGYPVEGRFSEMFWNGDSPEWYFSNDLSFQYLLDSMKSAPPEALIQYIEHDDPRIRREAAMRMPISYLSHLKLDSDPRVRLAVCSRLAPKDLVEMMRDSNYSIRREVAKRIAPDYLQKMTSDSDVETRLNAYTRLITLNKI